MRLFGLAVIVLLGLSGWYLLDMRDSRPLADHAMVKSDQVVSEKGTTTPETPAVSTEIPVPPVPDPRTEASWKPARATVFWVGESEGADNGFIHNRSSAWDVDWEQHFGGYDDPECREGFHPCGFAPNENPFYVALPYNDIAADGGHKKDPRLPKGEDRAWVSDLKDRWIAVRAQGVTCYAQWEDVGPFGEDDIEYVFGDATIPLNAQGERAGIDLSPAVRDCLKVGGLSDVEWRHVEASDVPPGPWREIVTQPSSPGR